MRELHEATFGMKPKLNRLRKTSRERFRGKENGIISPKGNPDGEPKTFGKGDTDHDDENPV